MTNINQVIIAITYPVVTSECVKFVRGFEATFNGGVKPLFTARPECAQKFGPEGKIHVDWLNQENVGGMTKPVYGLFTAPPVPEVLFDDGKDYSTVDIAVLISSNYETMVMYEAFVDRKWSYKQDMGGNLITVGTVEGQPVCITPMIHIVQGIRILYVEYTSQVVSFPLIEAWVKAKINNPAIDYLSSVGTLEHAISNKLAALEQEKSS